MTLDIRERNMLIHKEILILLGRHLVINSSKARPLCRPSSVLSLVTVPSESEYTVLPPVHPI